MKYLFLTSFLLINLITKGQPTKYYNINFVNGQLLNKKETVGKNIYGSPYLHKDWRLGSIKLFSGDSISHYPLKLDLSMNEIEIKFEGEVKVLPISLIKDLYLMNNIGENELLRNAKVYNAQENGLFLVIYDGNTSMFKKIFLSIKEPNYDPAYGIGNTNRTYIKKVQYFIVQNGKLKKIDFRKKKILKVFKDKLEAVKKYATENNLSFKNESDLAKIFEYYNSL